VFFDKVYDLLGTRGYTRLFMVIYAYICSMVKGCMRALNHPKILEYARTRYMARGRGAIVPLSTR